VGDRQTRCYLDGAPAQGIEKQMATRWLQYVRVDCQTLRKWRRPAHLDGKRPMLALATKVSCCPRRRLRLKLDLVSAECHILRRLSRKPTALSAVICSRTYVEALKLNRETFEAAVSGLPPEIHCRKRSRRRAALVNSDTLNDKLDKRRLRSKRHQHPLFENRRVQAPAGSTPWIDRKRSLLDSFGTCPRK
jgi:hypothetical protein